MFRFILNKLLYLVPTFIGITIVAFAFVRVLPGDPVLLMAGERGVSPERHAELMAQLGFDRPIWQQYLDYVWNLLHGDFGQSLVTKKPVLVEFFALFPATVELSICAIILAICLGIPAGVIARSSAVHGSIRALWAFRWLATRCRFSGGRFCSSSSSPASCSGRRFRAAFRSCISSPSQASC